MKSEFHSSESLIFVNKLSILLLFVFSIFIIDLYRYKDYSACFYLFLGIVFVAAFKFYFINLVKSFSSVSKFFLIVFPTYLSYNVLAYLDYSIFNLSWMFLIPIGASLLYSFKTVIKLFFGILIFTIVLYLIQLNFPFFESNKFTNTNSFYRDLLEIICFISFLLFFAVEHFKIQKKYKIYLEEQNAKIEERQSHRFKLENEKLLNEITSYIIDNKLYTQYDLTIQTLCKSIGKSYFEVSKILKNNNIPSYKIYINSIRIQKIVDKINKGALENYTIQTLYQENGFEHQSTFNRVFKEITGQTPSEFVKNLDKNQN